MNYLYDLPCIPKDQVESVKWEGDYLSYDMSLYSLGKNQYNEFIILNPMLNQEILKNIKLGNDLTARCIVWYHNETWIAKLFTKGWQTRYGYLNKAAFAERLDVIFISYGELNAEKNWQRVLEKAPWAKRIDGVTGILEAHKAAANIAATDMFYVVDGDAYLVDTWNFDHHPGLFDRDCIFVWHSQNPINGLEYGYGGVKLFPTHILKSAVSWNTDLTTSVGNKLKVMSSVSNFTNFNTDEFNTWRSAFRECAKLASGNISKSNNKETADRLQIWRTVATGNYSQYAIAGANAGYEYGAEHKLDIDKLKLINNHKWLEEQYNKWNTNT